MGLLLMVSLVSGYRSSSDYVLHDGRQEKPIKKKVALSDYVALALFPLLGWGFGHLYFWLSQ